MCGIAGVRKFGDTPITGEELILLLCALEYRGNHATGIALQDPDGFYVFKAAEPAWQFTRKEEFKAFLTEHLTERTTVALLHTRWATVGNPEENENNHPICDDRTAIVHNGCISNHESLFFQGKYEKACKTDSDIIRATLSAHGINEKGIRELCKMAGSAAIAAISLDSPGKLLLARSGSPLVYGFSPSGDKLYWASDAKAILTAAKPFYSVRGVWVQDTRVNISIGSMPDDTAWIFGDDAIELHHKFNTCNYYTAPDYSGGRVSYHTKTRNWKRSKKYLTPVTPLLPAAVTPSPMKGSTICCSACGAPNINTDGLPWSDLSCFKCKAALE